MVLVGSLEPGSNAEKCGKIHVGDMVCYLGKEPNRMSRVEGFDLDQTMAQLKGFASTGQDSVTLVLKRLVKRETVQVTFTYAPEGGEEQKTTLPLLCGSNLRKEMLRQGRHTDRQPRCVPCMG